MTIKQLSVFLENRKGSLGEVLSTLGDNDVNIVALSLADTEEYGILRMIVSDPEKGKTILREQGFHASLTDVLAIRFSHDSGSLSKVMDLLMEEVNVEYMYAFANGEDASAILKISDAEKARNLLENNEIKVWSEEEAYNLNQR